MNSCSVRAGTDGMHDQHRRHRHQRGDRREIAQRVVAEVRIEHDIDRHRAGIAEHQHMAVGRRRRHHLGGDHAAGAGNVLDHEGLAERGGELLREQPREHIRDCRPAPRPRSGAPAGSDSRIALREAPVTTAPGSARASAKVTSASFRNMITSRRAVRPRASACRPPCRLFGLDVGGLHQLATHGETVLDDGGELGRRAGATASPRPRASPSPPRW